MSYKSILVDIDEKKTSVARIDLALELARVFEAHVTGMVQIYPLQIPYHAVNGLKQEIEKRQAAFEHERAMQAIGQFDSRASAAGVASVGTRTEMGDAAELLTLHARYHDLAVVGQVDPDAPVGRQGAAGIMDQWVTSTGRPVLVVPYIGYRQGLLDHVLVAWDGGTQATRAVTDALPLLRRARLVTVLTIDAERTGNHGEEPGADIALFLARHGVKVEVRREHSGDLEIGTFLLSQIADLGASMVVMGAYAHSRLRELILGGVTRVMLDSMTVPTLFSH